MKVVITIFSIFASIEAYAQCAPAYLDPIYICNYKRQPKVTNLVGYEKKILWFKKKVKYTNGWRQIDFEDLLIVRSRQVGEKAGLRVNRSYNFLDKNEVKYTHFQINFNCNDVAVENQPNESVQIIEADSSICKKYPENSLIEIGD